MNDEDELLAAELAFGLIAGEERRAAEARADIDPPFADAVARWQAHAAALVGAGEAPRPSIWAAIEARLPANDTAPRRDSGRWRTVAIAASLLAGVMTVVAVERRPATPPPAVRLAPAPPLVAMLSGAPGKGVVAVSFDPRARRLTFAATAFDPGRHSAELWVIPADKKPRSLGVIDTTAPRTELSRGDAAAAVAPGVTLAVSIEPIGGSPTGLPTGPVVLSGTVQKS
ncbi:anti-sigma-K factor RskA [Sphingomonas vulcanisoli]|uniref:Anti-sigma-K factor RskA n=1 Tax=Sphingomonas vulcanisoli TaxID=1658060 RepID=A0ABX0TS92_9SPHN|nr:anti-sigma factor [Sphingomonas vulcanisoli]NIJ08394.1 anti-sigma-K factor RskA [Sphingomonas vulcanisoli]